MDLGIDLLANPHKIKKKSYLIDKKEEDFNLKDFILDTIIEELQIDLEKHPKKFLDKIIDLTLKISEEDRKVDISHLENLSEKKNKEKLPQVLTKKLKLKKIITIDKEPKVEVKKLPTI